MHSAGEDLSFELAMNIGLISGGERGPVVGVAGRGCMRVGRSVLLPKVPGSLSVKINLVGQSPSEDSSL